MPFAPDGLLPLRTDPKLAWAQIHLVDHPVDLKHADPHELLRVPGIGPRGVEAIVRARRAGSLRDASSLRKAGISLERASPFILLDGRRAAQQLSLF
jgi:predicted DNA-binding helix-hairpin-helix protein